MLDTEKKKKIRPLSVCSNYSGPNVKMKNVSEAEKCTTKRKGIFTIDIKFQCGCTQWILLCIQAGMYNQCQHHRPQTAKKKKKKV